MQTSYSQLLVFGSIAKDELMTFDGQFQDHIDPNKLASLNVSFVASSLKQELGGIATNISYNFSLLSTKPVYVLGGLGKDGQYILDFFQQHNISTDFLIQSQDLYTGTYKAISDKQQNQIGAFYQGANEIAKQIKLDTIPNLEQSLLILSANDPEAFLAIQKQAIDLKVDYLYDPGMALSWIDKNDLEQGILQAKYLVANEYEMQQIIDRLSTSVNDLVKHGLTIITTQGQHGVTLQDQNVQTHVEAYKTTDFKDPTGAGDSFRGGFTAGILEGLDTLESLAQGNALASFAVESYGGVNHKPNPSEVDNRKQVVLG